MPPVPFPPAHAARRFCSSSWPSAGLSPSVAPQVSTGPDGPCLPLQRVSIRHALLLQTTMSSTHRLHLCQASCQLRVFFESLGIISQSQDLETVRRQMPLLD